MVNVLERSCTDLVCNLLGAFRERGRSITAPKELTEEVRSVPFNEAAAFRAGQTQTQQSFTYTPVSGLPSPCSSAV
jgi:hypothetical protein